jgi:hypothetical protein
MSTSSKMTRLGDDALIKRLAATRSAEESGFLMKLGVGVLMLGVVGSVGTFARISRVSHSSGVRSTALMKLNAQLGLTPLEMSQRVAEAALLAARVRELKSGLRQRHPLWYPHTDEEQDAADEEALRKKHDDVQKQLQQLLQAHAPPPSLPVSQPSPSPPPSPPLA